MDRYFLDKHPMGPIYTISKLIGFDPCFKYNEISSILSLVTCIICFVLNLTFICIESFWNSNQLNIMNMVTNSMINFVAIIACYAVSKWVQKFIDKLASIDKVLDKFGDVLIMKKDILKYQYFLVFAFFILPSIATIIVLNLSTQKIYVLSLTYTHNTRQIMLSQFVCLVDLIRKRFIFINNELILLDKMKYNVKDVMNEIVELCVIHSSLRKLVYEMNYTWGTQFLTLTTGAISANFLILNVMINLDNTPTTMAVITSIIVLGSLQILITITICENTVSKTNMLSLHFQHERVIIAALGVFPINLKHLGVVLPLGAAVFSNSLSFKPEKPPEFPLSLLPPLGSSNSNETNYNETSTVTSIFE
ncbi:hypothetical protein O3M35_009046 [Rhynocoris fuscipes]|uniref:Gustatory receptor n=1 Tax=Rhynocoris fuscipes TaxID=488301 RepID=A0AAW1D2D4_9HEMI